MARSYYATVSSAVNASADISGALVGDGSVNSATPTGPVRLHTLTCAITAGTNLTSLAAVTNVYLASDSAGRHPLTDPAQGTKLGLKFSGAVGGFAVNIDQELVIDGSVYAIAKMAAGKSGTGAWRLTWSPIK